MVFQTNRTRLKALTKQDSAICLKAAIISTRVIPLNSMRVVQLQFNNSPSYYQHTKAITGERSLSLVFQKYKTKELLTMLVRDSITCKFGIHPRKRKEVKHLVQRWQLLHSIEIKNLGYSLLAVWNLNPSNKSTRKLKK